jgi:hypothetical protein
MSEAHYSKSLTNGELIDELRRLQVERGIMNARFLELDHQGNDYLDRWDELQAEYRGQEDDIRAVRADLRARGVIKTREMR